MRDASRGKSKSTRRDFLLAAGAASAIVSAGAAEAQQNDEHTVAIVPGGLEKFFRDVSASNVEMPRDATMIVEISSKYGLAQPPSSLPLSTNH